MSDGTIKIPTWALPIRYDDRLRSLILLGSIYKRSEQQQKIVNERFDQAKKELKLSRQALKRWFSDK